MWKVLIVEDEVFVRESIREIIRWEELGFTVVGEAGTGKQALAMIRELEPDLVLTDIVMPEMDGIELLRQAREQGYDCRFIMLSCLGEFDAVRQAMEYGASNYILKLSMSVQSLRDTLTKMSRELSSRSHGASGGSQAWCHPLWESLFHYRPTIDVSREWPPFLPRAGLVSVVAYWNHRPAPDPEAALKAAATNRDRVVKFEKFGLTTLFVWSDKPVQANLPFSVPKALNVEAERLPEAWREVVRKLDYDWYGILPSVALPHPGSFARSDVLPWEMEKALLQAFEQGDRNGCGKVLDEIWNRMRDRLVPMPMVKYAALELLDLCMRAAQRSCSGETLQRTTTHPELKDALLRTLADHFPQATKPPLTDHPEINKILDIIHRDYSQPLTVKSLADSVAMDENYVSGLFKRKTGKNLIAYLHEVRIRAAMRLLRETTLSVSEVGQQVGFLNDNYFIKIFKRITNLTPSDYKKSVQRRND